MSLAGAMRAIWGVIWAILRAIWATFLGQLQTRSWDDSRCHSGGNLGHFRANFHHFCSPPCPYSVCMVTLVLLQDTIVALMSSSCPSGMEMSCLRLKGRVCAAKCSCSDIHRHCVVSKSLTSSEDRAGMVACTPVTPVRHQSHQ